MIKLTQREKTLIITLGVCLVGVIIWGIYTAISSVSSSKASQYQKNREALVQLEQLHTRNMDLETKIRNYESMLKSNQQITSLIEEKAEAEKILNNKVYMRENPTSAINQFQGISTEVKFEGVNIENLLRFIYDMENSSRFVKISYLRISKPLKGKNTYDAQIKFDSYNFIKE